MIDLNLKLFLGSVLAPGMSIGAYFEFIFVLEIYSSTETQYKLIMVKISEMNWTIISKIA